MKRGMAATDKSKVVFSPVNPPLNGSTGENSPYPSVDIIHPGRVVFNGDHLLLNPKRKEVDRSERL